MSKNQQAPGELERVRAFVNTADIEQRTDALQTPQQLASWLRDAGLADKVSRVTAEDLERAIELREALRAVLLSHNGGEPPGDDVFEALDATARRADLRLRFEPRGESALKSRASGVAGALGQLLVAVHAAQADGSWTRLKACRDQECAWAFYDNTKNRSGAWCTMEVCGNRAKARSYRERRAAAHGP